MTRARGDRKELLGNDIFKFKEIIEFSFVLKERINSTPTSYKNIRYKYNNSIRAIQIFPDRNVPKIVTFYLRYPRI